MEQHERETEKTKDERRTRGTAFLHPSLCWSWFRSDNDDGLPERQRHPRVGVDESAGVLQQRGGPSDAAADLTRAAIHQRSMRALDLLRERVRVRWLHHGGPEVDQLQQLDEEAFERVETSEDAMLARARARGGGGRLGGGGRRNGGR